MQHYRCFTCREDALGGRTIICDGMFFKVCKNCAEDDDIYHELQKCMMEEQIEEQCETKSQS